MGPGGSSCDSHTLCHKSLVLFLVIHENIIGYVTLSHGMFNALHGLFNMSHVKFNVYYIFRFQTVTTYAYLKTTLTTVLLEYS